MEKKFCAKDNETKKLIKKIYTFKTYIKQKFIFFVILRNFSIHIMFNYYYNYYY